MRPALLAALAAVPLAACGTPSADLFVVERSGTLPRADLTLRVSDGGTVTCDGVPRPLPEDLLLDARELSRDLQPLLERRLRLPADEDALLRFRVTGEGGSASFPDTAAARHPVLGRLVAFVRATARRACGRPR